MHPDIQGVLACASALEIMPCGLDRERHIVCGCPGHSGLHILGRAHVDSILRHIALLASRFGGTGLDRLYRAAALCFIYVALKDWRHHRSWYIITIVGSRKVATALLALR